MSDTFSSPDRPFIIEHRRIDESPTGFTPDARLIVTTALRTSGLLTGLSDEQARTLLALLTFLSPNGFLQASAWEVAGSLAISEQQAQERLNQLATVLWQGEPVLYFIPRENSLPVYTLSNLLIHTEEALNPPESQPVLQAAGREAVIAHSRAAYARPRAEVEREIARLNGWDVPEEFATEEERTRAQVREKLMLHGIPRAQADDLLSRFDLERITRQIEWLPYRPAKSPARFLAAAIEGDYDAPRFLQTSAPQMSAEETTAAEPSSVAPVSEPALLPDMTAAIGDEGTLDLPS